MQIKGLHWLRRRHFLLLLVGLAGLIVLLWLVRSRLATEFAAAYFRSHGISSSVEVGTLGLSGVSGRFALGPKDAPEISADAVEVRFDPLRWIPRIVDVRLVNPVIRARMDEQGNFTLPSLQRWLDSLNQGEEKSRFVSDDLTVSLDHLRVLLTTTHNTIELNGDLKLAKGIPISGTIGMRPTTLSYQGQTFMSEAASIEFSTTPTGVQGMVRLSGTLVAPQLQITSLKASFAVSDLRWKTQGKALSFTAPTVRIQLAARDFRGDVQVNEPALNVTARKVSVLLSGAELEGQADLAINAGANFSTEALRRRFTLDPAMGTALARNLNRLDLTLEMHVERQAKQVRFAATAPLVIKGSRGAVLRVPVLAFEGPENSLRGAVQASLAGGGLPGTTFSARNIVWNDGGLEGDTSFASRFDFAMLRGADISTTGKASWRDDTFTFKPSACARVALASFRPGTNSMAENVRGQLCAQGDRPLLAVDSAGWKMAATSKDGTAYLPLGNAVLDNVSTRLSFEGKAGGVPQGKVDIASGDISDRTVAVRFNRLRGSGAVTLTNWIWNGQLALTSADQDALGDVQFTHTMSNSSGSAHITATNLNLKFALDKLQPEEISPMLAALRRAEGSARFDGEVGWTPSGLTSHGILVIDALDFMTPLGKAHAVNTNIVFTSLLPPVTAPGQTLTISRIDWTLPFSSVGVRFSFGPTAIKIDGLDTGFAEGRVALGAFTVNLADPGRFEGAAEVSSIALSSLITASNLSNRVKMEGKVTGRVPFTVTPEGFRVVNGRVAADGPGRLSIDRALWTQGATAINSVQDFAYQALENLAFDELSAELNSVANGRLQIVFHIKGRSDPPKPQVADIAITDLVNGTALQKPIPLPSGTPIDLTLDTSLNFDELLKSYTEAWSNTVSPAGQTDTARRATQ